MNLGKKPNPTRPRSFPTYPRLDCELPSSGMASSIAQNFIRSGKKVRLFSYFYSLFVLLMFAIDHCHRQELRWTRQRAQQRRPKRSFLLSQTNHKLPTLWPKTWNSKGNRGSSWGCAFIFKSPVACSPNIYRVVHSWTRLHHRQNRTRHIPSTRRGLYRWVYARSGHDCSKPPGQSQETRFTLVGFERIWRVHSNQVCVYFCLSSNLPYLIALVKHSFQNTSYQTPTTFV